MTIHSTHSNYKWYFPFLFLQPNFVGLLYRYKFLTTKAHYINFCNCIALLCILNASSLNCNVRGCLCFRSNPYGFASMVSVQSIYWLFLLFFNTIPLYLNAIYLSVHEDVISSIYEKLFAMCRTNLTISDFTLLLFRKCPYIFLVLQKVIYHLGLNPMRMEDVQTI